MLRLLVQEYGADANHAMSAGATPVFMCAQEGHLEILQCLVEELGADVNKATNEGCTPLYIAAQNGHTDVVQCLARAIGFDVNKATNGETPLYIAARYGYVDVVQCLASLGGDVNRANNGGRTPLFAAAEYGQLDVVRYLGNQTSVSVDAIMDNGVTSLYIAAQNGHVNVVRCLAALGGDVNHAILNGGTILYVAAQNGHLDIVQALVKEFGAYVKGATPAGGTPLLVAAHQGHLHVVRWLLEDGGARVNEVDRHGNTVWNALKLKGTNFELTSLFQFMMLLGEPDVELIEKLSPHQHGLVMRRRQLRAQLPAYLEQQQASVVEHCPLPMVLQPLVAAYAVPTSEDVWTDGLHYWVDECSRPGCCDAAHMRCTACKQVRYCGQPCQRAHWKAHKANCKRLRVELDAVGKAASK